MTPSYYDNAAKVNMYIYTIQCILFCNRLTPSYFDNATKVNKRQVLIKKYTTTWREIGREGGPLSWVKLKIILQKIFYDQARLYYL